MESSVHAEWEVVLLNAFSKIGKVFHEKQFGGSRKCDVYFESLTGQDAFLADITTISDKGLDKLNSFQWVFDELMRTVRDHGLRQHSFRLEVGTYQVRHFKEGPKVQLKIPGQARTRQLIFNEKFREFLSNIAHSPLDRAIYAVKSDEADVVIGYYPNQKYASGGHTSYKVVYSLNENLLYSSLLEKANQLRGTGFRGPLGVFVCDGGCEFLSTSMSRGLSYELKDVIHQFLREEQSHERLPVQFVVTFGVVYSNQLNLSSARIDICLYTIPVRYEVPLDVMAILKRLQKALPLPERNAVNAISLLRGANPYEGASFWGGLTMSERRVKISARGLLELLAGTVSQEDFLKAHGFIESEDTRHAINAFQRALKSGRLISNVSIENVGSADDDWIIFEFGEPDPAVLPFAIPRQA
jgi:hypothetical protein